MSLLHRRHRSATTVMGPAEDAHLAMLARVDREAFAAIYHRHFAGIYGYCYRQLGSTEQAEDAAQQVFAHALAALPRYEEEGRFRSWLYTIAHHVISAQYRTGPVDASLDVVADVADPGSSPEEQALNALERMTLLKAIDRLPRDQRRVIQLRIAGMKGREIATELGRSHEAVRMLQHRALDHLASLMSAEQPRGGPHGG